MLENYMRSVERHRFSLLSLPGVVSVGIGYKMTRNVGTGRPCLVVGVEKKTAHAQYPVGSEDSQEH